MVNVLDSKDASGSLPPDGGLSPARRRGRSAGDVLRPGWFVKIALMALLDAALLFCLVSAVMQESWIIAGALTAALAALNYAYFTNRSRALKYLLPGILLLLAYNVFGIAYNGYIAFTNYGDGHYTDKQGAIDAALAQHERRVEGSEALPTVVVLDDDELGLAVVVDDEVQVGTATEPLEEVPEASVDGTTITAVPGWQVLGFADLLERQTEVTELRVPVSDDVEDGSLRTPDGRTAYLYQSTMVYDAATDTLTDTTTGVVYHDNGRGNFADDDGETLQTGWVTVIGWDNFAKPFTDARLAPVVLQVFVWSVVFALSSVVLSFLFGLVVAVVMNSPRLRGQRYYRSVMILPYAFPGFMSALLWAGMLNTKYGFINQVFLGGAEIPWLTDPLLAKVALIGVNLWLGFPYMFLICTGALQAIPDELTEAARIDGASGTQVWYRITLPLLLVAVAPLLIAGFAFNFNNFSLIYMLTRGGPPFPGSGLPIGQTDILISMVYQISGLSGTGAREYALASAMSILIFIFVGVISLLTFRRTRQLEEIA
ncbi:Fructose-bisphosphate aldolase [Beutenbergia cavernae DSM 12333]|uniref:Maltose/maltodextrin transport system permease protein n=1 Tax=Beutenbergia cavernae (strain ATCC BAA-8 / DSM 12333 / CCUG 43141 / JCM 11478 / NBRC 16432 / NCIMB 13614 / HKI 0122) TaxID=471853 RepID=C5C2Q4_BEUC1|nr:ABC transporter permease subunit [Beutenbergia cavernae]ACQ79740.1 Fructose-bisphosphate aldolase [Beutenbergia cavernae DSM 12333]